jgi:iron complex outermembrane receptor protein
MRYTTLAFLLLASFLPPLSAADSIRVRVLDSQEGAVPDARIEARGSGTGHAVAVVLTGVDGVAQLAVPLPCEITVQATGFEPVRQRVDSQPGDAFTVRLRPAMVLTSVDVVVRDEPDPATVSASDLEIGRTGARTVLDAVERLVPGAFVTRRGVMGYGISTNGTGGISIRGIGESPNAGVLVVVDGRPDFQGQMGHPLPDFYSLSDAGAVTVIEGPASVLYGTNAMGGVVEVKNWEPPEGMTTRLTSAFGSFNTGQYNLTHGARFRRGFYSLNAGVGHTAGDRPSSAFRDQDGTVTAGYDLSSVWKASLEGRYGHFYVEDPGPLTAPLAASFATVGRGGFSANLDNASSRTWGYARGFSNYGKNFITDGFRSTDRASGFRLDQNIAVTPQLTLELGSDIVNYGGRARNAISLVSYGDHHINTTAGFARGQWAATHRLRLHTGLRYEHNSQFGSIAVPEAGGSFKIAEGYSISADVAKGFRNPTIRELYLFPAPNPLLQPERVWNYQSSLQMHPIRSLAASLTGYYADLSNLIVTTGRYPNMQLLNTGRALNRGLETTVRWRVHRRVSVQSGYAYLRSTNLAPYLPANKWNYSIDVDAGRAFVTFGGMAVGERWKDVQHSGKMNAYTLGTLKVTLPVARNWRLFTLVDNLWNRSYQVVPGYPMPGINVMGGFTLSF